MYAACSYKRHVLAHLVHDTRISTLCGFRHPRPRLDIHLVSRYNRHKDVDGRQDLTQGTQFKYSALTSPSLHRSFRLDRDQADQHQEVTCIIFLEEWLPGNP
jgi:hypothetical protein